MFQWRGNTIPFSHSLLPSLLRFLTYVSPFTFHLSRIPLHVLSIVLLSYFLLSPRGDLAAQSIPPPVADDDGSETPVDEPSEAPSGAQESLPEKKEPPAKTSQLNPEDTLPEEGEVVAKGDDLIFHGDLMQIHGNGLIRYEEVVLYADHIWADFNENIMRAAGNVRLIVENEETHANELIYNLETKQGIVREGFTYSDPWYYRGTEIFKVEADESYIRGGSLTTCSLKHPHFYFSASEIIVKINKELIAKHIVLKVGGIPLFYFPAYRRDLRKDKVAKVIVKIGSDNYQGAFLSVILPLARRPRYDGALLFDQTARRGRGGGGEGKYRVNDVKYQEIFIPLPPDPTPSERTKLEAKAQELSDRLQGKYDNYKLRQIFLEYKIDEEDITRAQEKANEIYTQLQAEDAVFAEIAEDNSDHQETRYQGGNMGFLVHGEHDAEGELRLHPILEEAAFQLQLGEITPILRTESAFHILKVDRVLDIYAEREIQVRRIDIAIEPSSEAKEAIQDTAEGIQERAIAGESFEKLAAEYEEAELSEVNEGVGMPLNEMDRRWKYSVSRLEEPGDITRTVMTDRGIYIFLLIEKEPTPSFEEIASQFEAEWPTLEEEMLKSRKPENQNGDESTKSSRSRSRDRERELSVKEPDAVMSGTDKQHRNRRGVRRAEESEGSESTDQRSNDTADKPEADEDDKAEAEEGEEEEEVQVYRKHGYRGRWEMPRNVASQAQQLYSGEMSGVIKTQKGYRLIKVDKRYTFRGDFLLLSQDQFSFSRQKPFKTGQRWTLRWGHTHTIYTPWDNREKGRRPVSLVSRVAWQARNFKEGFGESESTVSSFAVLTWGSAFSALDDFDKDEDGNLRFSTKTIGEFLGRLQVNHTLNLTDEGTTNLQKLPELDLSLSRMRLNRLPLFKTVDSGLTRVADKLHTDLPILSMFGFPTLENTSFDLDISLGNFFRERFRDEEDVFLQTMDLGFQVQKQSTSQITPNRELRLDVDFESNLIWHDRDRDGNRNIFRGVYGVRLDARSTLFRIYDISFIPGARRMRHQIDSTLTSDYQPPVEREDDNLYPFGPSTYFFERKDLSYIFRTSIEVKTRRSKSALRLLDFTTRLRADFTEFAAQRRRADPISLPLLGGTTLELIESDLRTTPLASRNLSITVRTTHDPNKSEVDGKRFKMVGIRSNINYRRTKWDFSFGSSFNKRTGRASRDFTGSWGYRPSRLFELDFSATYDWIEKQFYSQRLTMRRNLHGWNLTISWYRTGLKRGTSFDSVRQDFIFQLNLIEESAASVGLGYDATTDEWGFRSLPAGVPSNAFGAGNTLGRSYF